MITEQNLIDAGYTKFRKPSLHEHADYLYQKRIKDEHGTKYFIDIYHYPPLDYGLRTKSIESTIPEAWVVELHCGGKFVFTMFHPNILSLVEFNCQLFWETFWGKYYSE